MDNEGSEDNEKIWTPSDPDDETAVKEREAQENGTEGPDGAGGLPSMAPQTAAQGPPAPPPSPPVRSNRPVNPVLFFRGGIGVTWTFLLFMLFGYLSLVSIGLLFSPGMMGGIVLSMVFIPLFFLVILMFHNKGGIYENGIMVSRPLYERLRGGKTFFQYEEILAFYAATYESSKGMFSMRVNWSRSSGSSRSDRFESSYGRTVAAMTTDPGMRRSVAVVTDEGTFIIHGMKDEDIRSDFYQEMMNLIRRSLGQRGLPLVRVPLQLTDEEVAALQKEAAPIPWSWFSQCISMAVSLPLTIIGVAYALFLITHKNLGDATGPLLILAVLLSTVIFVIYYQRHVGRTLKAVNRLQYYKASLAAESGAYVVEPLAMFDYNEGDGIKF